MTQIAPPNSTSLEKALDILAATRLGAIATPLRDVWSPADCPEELLPWLAWALSIDSWDATWPIQVRRARVAAAIAVQRRKGTVQSIRDVVTSFGGNIVMREWFENDPPATPHTFGLNIAISGSGGEVPSATFIGQVIDEVARTKPVRSHFTFTVAEEAIGVIGIIGAARPTIYARLPLLADAVPDSRELLSGDQQVEGADAMALSGDQQVGGSDALLLTVYS